MFPFFGNYLEPFSYAIYLIAVIIYYRFDRGRNGKLLCTYYGLATLLMLTASLYVRWKLENIWIYNLAALFAIVFIGIYFYHVFESRTKKNTVLTLVGLYTVYALIKNVFLREISFFDSVGYSLVSAFIAVIVFMYFHQLLKRVSEHDILRQFNFWLASGYLIYFVGSFIIFVSYYYLTQKIINTYTKPERDLLTALWGVHNVLLFISAFSLLIGSLWLTYRKRSA